MSSNPHDHLNGRREVAVADASATEAALQKMKPLLRPDKEQEARLILSRTISKVHTGPIPSAEEMEHLERIHVGAAERCFSMAEREQEHRHYCDTQVIAKEFGFRSRGQWMALVIAVVLLAVVVYIAGLVDTKAAAALGGATLVGLVAAFTARKYIEAKADQPESAPSELPSNQKTKASGGKGR